MRTQVCPSRGLDDRSACMFGSRVISMKINSDAVWVGGYERSGKEQQVTRRYRHLYTVCRR